MICLHFSPPFYYYEAQALIYYHLLVTIPRDPSIQSTSTLDLNFCEYYLHWAIWIPRGHSCLSYLLSYLLLLLLFTLILILIIFICIVVTIVKIIICLSGIVATLKLCLEGLLAEQDSRLEKA